MTGATLAAHSGPGVLKRDTAEPIVRVAALVKRFRVRRGWREVARRPLARAHRMTAVEDVSFEVFAGELFGLLGGNGAGKTTLFRMLGAQLLPDGGKAIVAGHDVAREPREVRELLAAVVADERSLDWRLNARENLELFAALYAVPRFEVAARVRELLERVELHEAGNKMVGSFSSGMKQRLLIARALLPRPRVLLLDEPTRSLDPISARRFRHFLREEVVRRQGCTVLLATHDTEEATDFCDRVAVLDRGRLLALGPIRELNGEINDKRYRFTVRSSDSTHAIAAIRRMALPGPAPIAEGPAGWAVLDVRVPGGPDVAARIVAVLTAAGIDVCGVEQRRPALADLLERVIQLQANP